MSATVTPARMSARKSVQEYLKSLLRNMGRSSSGMLRRVFSKAAMIYIYTDVLQLQKIRRVDYAQRVSINHHSAFRLPSFDREKLILPTFNNTNFFRRRHSFFARVFHVLANSK